MRPSSGSGSGLSMVIRMRKKDSNDLNSELRANLMGRAADYYCDGKLPDEIAALINKPTTEVKGWLSGQEWQQLMKDRRQSSIDHVQAMLPGLRVRAASALIKLLNEKDQMLLPAVRAATALKILYTYQNAIEMPDTTPKLPDFTPDELRENINQIYGIYPIDEPIDDSDDGIPRVLRSAEVDDISD
jgi:uncharacterized protein (UPF0147 family)